MQNQIVVINNGINQNVELISFFEVINTGKKYLFYTLNEKVENGLVKMYAASVNNYENGFILDENMTDEEWANLKTIMKTILTSGTDSNIKYLSVD